jgi:hypothetical protein
VEYSKKQPHAATSAAKTKVEQLQKELANAPTQKGIASDLALLEDVPLGSMAMLVCRVWVNSNFAAKIHPRRSSMAASTNVDKVIHTPNRCLAVPVFLMHFS